MANNIEEGGKLSHLFDEIWAMREKLENSMEPSISDTVQVVLTIFHSRHCRCYSEEYYCMLSASGRSAIYH